MTTPSGLPLSALQYWGVARGAVANRVSTAEFYSILRAQAEILGPNANIPDFATVNQLRSNAVQARNAQERFQRSPGANVIDASMIARVPYGRSLDAQAAMPIYHVGINLHTVDMGTGEQSSQYRIVQFTGALAISKDELFNQVGQDAEALADAYGQTYAGHDVIEILAA